MKRAQLNIPVHPDLKAALQRKADAEAGPGESKRNLARYVRGLLAKAILSEAETEQPKLLPQKKERR